MELLFIDAWIHSKWWSVRQGWNRGIGMTHRELLFRLKEKDHKVNSCYQQVRNWNKTNKFLFWRWNSCINTRSVLERYWKSWVFWNCWGWAIDWLQTWWKYQQLFHRCHLDKDQSTTVWRVGDEEAEPRSSKRCITSDLGTKWVLFYVLTD